MEHVKLAAALCELVKFLPDTPALVIIAIILVLPLLLLAWALFKLVRALIDLRDEVRQDNNEANDRYDNNVQLVKDYEELARELTTQIRLNTSTQTQMVELLKQVLRK